MMRWRSARRQRGPVLAASLKLPDPFDVSELCRTIGRQRGRPIIVSVMPLAALGLCGLWLATEAADHICYESDTSALHQQHIALHELGHILCGHGPATPLHEALAVLFPHLDSKTLKLMLMRRHDSFSISDEWEAETFAYAVLDRVNRSRDERGANADDPATELSRVLED